MYWSIRFRLPNLGEEESNLSKGGEIFNLLGFGTSCGGDEAIPLSAIVGMVNIPCRAPCKWKISGYLMLSQSFRTASP